MPFRHVLEAYEGYLFGTLRLAPGRETDFKARFEVCARTRHGIIVQLASRIRSYSVGAVCVEGSAFDADPPAARSRLQTHMLVARDRFLTFSVHSATGDPIREIAARSSSVKDAKDIDICLLDCGVGIPSAGDDAFFSHQVDLARDAEHVLRMPRRK